MNPLSLFIPIKHRYPNSKYNKNIIFTEFINSSFLTVDGLIESGEIMTRVWKKGITALLPKNLKPKKILLLGLAGGCNAHLINRYFPESQITAVEIDPVMVEIGKKYFRLGKVKNLNIVIADALVYAKNLQPKDQFDVVMVDCFVGKAIPKKLEDLNFLKALKSHSRFVLINRLWYRESMIVTQNFFRTLTDHFFFTKAHVGSNVVISLV